MRRIALILWLLPAAAFGQGKWAQGLAEADGSLRSKDYAEAMVQYRKLHSDVSKTDTNYKQVVAGLLESIYFNMREASRTNNWPDVVRLATEYMAVIKADKTYVDNNIARNLPWIYKDFVVACYATGDLLKAEEYKAQLYKAGSRKALPKGLDEHFNFDKFVSANRNVWGYEWYAEPDKDDESSFSKHVYYVYSRDTAGNDAEQLFTLQTVRVHKLDKHQPDYVLTKRTYTNSGEMSETLWQYTFNAPIPYNDLHQAVSAFLTDATAPVQLMQPGGKK